MTMTVTYANGGDSKVEVKPRSQIAFERKFDRSIADAFGSADALRFEYVYFLAWHASKSTVDFDDWLDSVEGIDMEVAGQPDPTAPVPSAGP